MDYDSSAELALPEAEYRLARRVRMRLGAIAHAALLTVLIDGAKAFHGLVDGQEETIRAYANFEGVTLPI